MSNCTYIAARWYKSNCLCSGGMNCNSTYIASTSTFTVYLLRIYRTPDGVECIKFGELFKLNEKVSNKCVGILQRARKHRSDQCSSQHCPFNLSMLYTCCCLFPPRYCTFSYVIVPLDLFTLTESNFLTNMIMFIS